MSFIRENFTDSLKPDNVNSTSTLVLKLPSKPKSIIQPVQ